jgi:hypothetical protein
MGGVMKITHFKPVLAVALFGAALFVSACVSTPTGESKGGWPIGKDTSTSRYPRSVDQVVEAARFVLKHNGKLLRDNSVDNTFIAKINERDVYVKVTKVDAKTTELVIMARGSMAGDIILATDLDKQIALQLTTVSP